MLRLRLIGPHDYLVLLEGRRPIGRIRWAEERSPGLWLWTVTLDIPGAPSGDASTINEAKSRFRAAWKAFKRAHSAEELQKAFETMARANRAGRFGR